ncbi:hypothetical protein OROGR_010406 [Orobanche gracilis]
MRKITGQLLSSKPVSISRAAKLLTRFAAVDNGSSATVSLYLQRTADAFNQLVQFHSKRPKNSAVEISPDRKKARKYETENHEKTPDAKTLEDSKNRGRKDKKTVNEAAEANPNEEDVRDLKREEKEDKKKKKMKSDDDGDDDSNKKKTKKRKRDGDEEKSKQKRID